MKKRAMLISLGAMVAAAVAFGTAAGDRFALRGRPADSSDYACSENEYFGPPVTSSALLGEEEADDSSSASGEVLPERNRSLSGCEDTEETGTDASASSSLLDPLAPIFRESTSSDDPPSPRQVPRVSTSIPGTVPARTEAHLSLAETPAPAKRRGPSVNAKPALPASGRADTDSAPTCKPKPDPAIGDITQTKQAGVCWREDEVVVEIRPDGEQIVVSRSSGEGQPRVNRYDGLKDLHAEDPRTARRYQAALATRTILDRIDVNALQEKLGEAIEREKQLIGADANALDAIARFQQQIAELRELRDESDRRIEQLSRQLARLQKQVESLPETTPQLAGRSEASDDSGTVFEVDSSGGIEAIVRVDGASLRVRFNGPQDMARRSPALYAKYKKICSTLGK
jgi:phage FluMu protein gp41